MDGDAEKCPEAEKKYFLGCGAPKFVGPCSSEWILDTVKRRKAITAQYKETQNQLHVLWTYHKKD